MPSFFDQYAGEAVDACFETFGEVPATTYTLPDSGAAVACTVILDRRDAGARPEEGRPSSGTLVLEVRTSHVAEPKTRGTFQIGAETYEIVNKPMLKDPSGLVWTMWVRIPQ